MEFNVSIKTIELTGAELDYWVSRALGYKGAMLLQNKIILGPNVLTPNPPYGPGQPTEASIIEYSPSSKWEHGGPIITAEEITLYSPSRGSYSDTFWEAAILSKYISEGPGWTADGKTPLIAAMRCFLVKRLGEEFDGSKL